MSSTDNFKKRILAYLEDRANTDVLFSATFQKENKNIEDCMTYIIDAVQQSGRQGFDDDEIFGIAVHYYDEDSIVIGNRIDCKIITNEAIQLTVEEVAEARERALQQSIQEEYKKLHKAPERARKENKTVSTELFLF